MNIVITNGTHEADFLVKKFRHEKHNLTMINTNREFGKYISGSNKVPVLFGDPTKAFVLEDAAIERADVLIALSENDIDNFVTCMTAKTLFQVKRTVCVVRNPKRVDLFKRLGVDSVICSTYLIGESIKNQSVLDDFIQTISIENDKILITELVIEDSYVIAHKKIKDAELPKSVNVSCIYRDPEVVIPDGETTILPGDKLVMTSTPDNNQMMVEFIQKRTNDNE